MDTPAPGNLRRTEAAGIYVGGELQRPFAALRAAIERDEGIFLLTGESGSGKSALLGKLAEELRGAGHKVVLTSPHNNAHLIAWLSGVHLAPGTLPAVLLIDEADQLTGEDLKKLALGMRVILSGSDDLAQRVPDASRMALSRLSKEDTESLVSHRLAGLGEDTVAGFPPETISVVAKEAEGLPRNAVQIIERASLIASMGNFPQVTPDHVRKAARSLGLGKEAAPSADRRIGGIGWAAALAASSVVLALALAGGLLFLPEYLPPMPEQAAREAPPEPQPSPARDVASLPASRPSPPPAEDASPVPLPPPSQTPTAALPVETPPAAAPEARDVPAELPTAAPAMPPSTASPSATPDAPAVRGGDAATAPPPETAVAILPAPTPPEPADSIAAPERAAEVDHSPAPSTFPPIPQRRPDFSHHPDPPRRRFVADAPIPERKPEPPVLASAAPVPETFTGSSGSPSPYCRPYRSRIDMTGVRAEVQGIACLDENGEWVLVQQERQ